MKTMIVHAALALAGLTLAWRLSTTEAEEQGGEASVTLFDCAQLEAASYKTQSRTIELERRSPGDEGSSSAFYWITATSVGADAPAAPSYYLARKSEGDDGWLDRYQPFAASRSLGEVNDEVTEELGLNDEADVLVLKCSNGTQEFRVGSSTHGAQGHRYVQGKDGGPIHLVTNAVISQLAQADSQLARRKLHDFETSEVEKLQVAGSGETITLRQRDRHDPRAAVWVDDANPDQRNDLYGNWMGRVTALSIRESLALGKQPGQELAEAQEAETVLELAYIGEGDAPLGQLTLARADNPEKPGVPNYYAKSGATLGWVTVPWSVARQVENTGRAVLGLEPLPDPEPAAETPEAGAESAAAAPPTGATTPASATPAAAPAHGGSGHAVPAHPGLPHGHP